MEHIDIYNIGKKSSKFFTLIELFSILAVIAILAAILFPVFGRARAVEKSAWMPQNPSEAQTRQTIT
jgi:Tfp pilus assembly protein PilE